MNLHEIMYAPTKGMIYNATPMVARMRTVGLWIAIVWFIFDIVNLGLPAFLSVCGHMVIPRIDISGDQTDDQTMEGPLLIFTGSHQKPPFLGDFPGMLDYQRPSPSEPRSQPLGPQVQQRRRGLRHGREEMPPARHLQNRKIGNAIFKHPGLINKPWFINVY